MGTDASCPRCDSPVVIAATVCPRCGFALIEERSSGRPRRLGRHARRPRLLAMAAALAGTALIVVGAAVLAGLGAPTGLAPSSAPLSAAQAERRLAIRYPNLRRIEEAVIACPDRAIRPGGEARCWVLARVGLQRSVVVRLSRRGNRVQIDD